MNYVLDDIADYLTEEGYTDILIDYATAPTSTTGTRSRVILMSSANSVQENNAPTMVFRFTVYVRNANRGTCQQEAMDIYNALKNRKFQRAGVGSVTVHDIQGNPPYFYGLLPQENAISEYAMNMQCTISNDDTEYYN